MDQSDSNVDTCQMMLSQPSDSSDLNSISCSKMLIYLSLVSFLTDITEDFQFNNLDHSVSTCNSRIQTVPPMVDFKCSYDQYPVSFHHSTGKPSK